MRPPTCISCGRTCASPHGVLDLAPHLGPEMPSFEQALMETRVFARVYESPLWRPLHTRLASGAGLRSELQALLSPLDGAPIRRALDLATGTGLYARAMAARHPGAEVWAMDRSLEMLQRASALDRGGHLRLARADAARIPLATGSVDHLNCAGALHLLDDTAPVWAEIARVLAPGGHLTVMTLTHPASAPAALRRWVEAHASFHPFTRARLEAELGPRFTELRVEVRRATLLVWARRALVEEGPG